jgi:hypothetical protein
LGRTKKNGTITLIGSVYYSIYGSYSPRNVVHVMRATLSVPKVVYIIDPLKVKERSGYAEGKEAAPHAFGPPARNLFGNTPGRDPSYPLWPTPKAFPISSWLSLRASRISRNSLNFGIHHHAEQMVPVFTSLLSQIL